MDKFLQKIHKMNYDHSMSRAIHNGLIVMKEIIEEKKRIEKVTPTKCAHRSIHWFD